MINVPYNDVYKKQNQKLIPSSIKKGIISNINTSTWTADVQIIGSNQSIIKNVPLASNLNADLILPGDRCKLDLFDETNPNDMVVAYTYGRRINPTSGLNQFTSEQLFTSSTSYTFTTAFRPTQIFFYGWAVSVSANAESMMTGQAGVAGSQKGVTVGQYIQFSGGSVVGYQLATSLQNIASIDSSPTTQLGYVRVSAWADNSVTIAVNLTSDWEIGCNIIITG